jgi:hypothetical protein
MKFTRKHRILVLVFLAKGALAYAQSAEPEMADALRQDGKIWVVVASLLVMFAGLVLYLMRLESKLTKLEKHQKSHEN